MWGSMLSFDRSSLETKAARVDGRLSPDDPVWISGDVRPTGDLHVTGRLSPAGEGRFYFSGRFEGEVSAECRRCLAPVTAPVADEVQFVLAEMGDEELDDSDLYVLDPREHMVDLRPALREQWLLSVPAFVVCREDCQGLCPHCGADLNEGPCACPKETDRRWDALKDLRGDG